MKKISSAWFAILFLFFSNIIIAQAPIIFTFNENAFPIQKKETLASIFATKKFIGVGEATHGSIEFVNTKKNIFYFLKKSNKYNTLFIELPYSIGLYLNDFINSRSNITLGFIDTLLRPAKALYSVEFLSFMDSIRLLNIHQKSNIRIYGFDPDQYYDFAVKRLQRLYGNLNKPDSSFLDSLLSTFPANYKLIENFEKEYLKSSILSSIELLIQFKQVIKKYNLQEEAKIEYSLCIDQLKYSYDFWNKPSKRKYNYRDYLMFLNIDNITNFFKISNAMIWAHNNHIRRKEMGNYKPMGCWLSEKYNGKYFAIGSVFNEGSYRVFFKNTLTIKKMEKGNSGSLAKFLSAINNNNFYISKDEVLKYFPDYQTIINDVGIMQTFDGRNANKSDLNIKNDFDAFLFFHKIKALKLY